MLQILHINDQHTHYTTEATELTMASYPLQGTRISMYVEKVTFNTRKYKPPTLHV